MKKILIVLTLTGFCSFSQTTIDFEDNGVGANWSWTTDANDTNPAIEFTSNPQPGGANSTTKAAKFTALPGGQPWALTFTDNIGSITFSENNSLVKMMVLKTVSTTVAIKFEDSSNPSFYKQIEVSNSITNGDWEELTFDFSTAIGNTYDRMVIIPDFYERSQTNIIYFDQISFNEGGATENYNLEDIDFEDDGFGANWVWTVHNNDTNPAVEIVPNPNVAGINTSDYVAKFTSKSNGAPWALTFTDNIGIFILNNDNKIIGVKVLKTVSSNFGVKLEYVNPIDNQVINYSEILSPTSITNGAWEQLFFDFTSDVGSTYNRLVIIPDFADRSQDNISYFDQISFGSTAGLDDNELGSVRLFPNPVSDQLYIKAQAHIQTIEVINILGQTLMSRVPNAMEIQLDTRNLQTGTYFVRISMDGTRETFKILKN